MPDRRTFLSSLGGAGAPAALGPARAAADATALLLPERLEGVPQGLAGEGRSPAVVQEAMQRHLTYSNEAPGYTIWRVLEAQKQGLRQRLARSFGCDAEEVAITREAVITLDPHPHEA